MSTGWFFIVAVGLIAVSAAFENEIGGLKNRLNQMAINNQDLDGRLKAIESDMSSVLKAMPGEEETIEEQWLRENHEPRASREAPVQPTSAWERLVDPKNSL
jgi:post-segregation antitoxin (ccd killing protein)